MPLRIYNSLTKQKEEFKPLTKGVVKMYVCGPTVYDEPHLGHLRSAYVFEMVRNYLEASGHRVDFIRNVTDIDDKIIEKARHQCVGGQARQGGEADLISAVTAVSAKYYDAYSRDLKALGIRPPKKEPRATAHVAEMIALIQKIFKKGFAYASDGDVYFNVAQFVDYGNLSHQNKDAMLEAVRIDANEKKKNALDFALWKKAKTGEPSWPSPWGEGRPGWHIECSAMSMKYLGETFDIHGGGLDLVFPHHENEIAQSECATGKTFAKIWMHHGLVSRDGQKMSKSLRNFLTLSDAAEHNPWAVEELKFLFLGTHYSAPLDYTEDRMRMQKAIRERFWFFFEELKEFKKSKAKPYEKIPACRAAFQKAMDDDFNSAEALSVMHEMVYEARKTAEPAFKLAYGNELKKMGKIFGLFSEAASAARSSAKNGAQDRAAKAIRERIEAKKNKDFAKADAIRQELLAEGIALTDHADGSTTWRQI